MDLAKQDEFLESALFTTEAPVSLTKREEEILRYLVAGYTNKETAKKICRSQRTVEYHRNRLMHKLDAHNAAELIKKTVMAGII